MTMKKKNDKRRRLKLSRTTIRTLRETSMTQVAGGTRTDPMTGRYCVSGGCATEICDIGG